MLSLRFLEEFGRMYDTTVPELSDKDISALMAHDWPGNIRELRNVVERGVILSRQDLGGVSDAITATQFAERPGLREAVAAFERQLIGKAIQTHQGRMDDAANALGIGRRTLNEKIVKLGLDKDALL